MRKIVSHGKRDRYFVVIEGHTDCGAIKASVGKLDAFADAGAFGLYHHVNLVWNNIRDVMSSILGSDASDDLKFARLAQANVDKSVARAVTYCNRLVKEHIIPEGKVTVLGAMRDVLGDIYTETVRCGEVFFTNVDGETDVQKMRACIADLCRHDGCPWISESDIEYTVRRV